MLREEGAHFVFGAVDGNQKTGVFHSSDAADPAVAFDNFPFSAFDFDAPVIRREQVKSICLSPTAMRSQDTEDRIQEMEHEAVTSSCLLYSDSCLLY
jgi:hypothetical protein